MAVYGKDERMRRYKYSYKGALRGVCMLAVTAAVCFGCVGEPNGMIPFRDEAISVAYAAEDMLGYENPKKIVIATPSTNNYSTTASKISILGACDYRYPLTMNGKTIETTEHGFFTTYVTLSEGENVFLFENGNHEYELTVTRKKSSGSSSGSSSTSKYKAVSNKMGELINPYTMPMSAPGTVKIDYLPLTQNTTFRIVGEWGNYYKLPDGTYVSKSAVKVYSYKMPSNKVSSAKVKYVEDTHTVETTFTMKIDALYDVQIDGDTVKFVLYDTTAGGSVTVPSNPLVKSVSRKTDANGRAIYTYTLYDGDKLCGFDVKTENGVMNFTLKYAPVLKKQGSLEGAVILLDAGHGDTDNGTVGAMGGFGPTEKTVNLDITKRVQSALEKMGATVVMVRSTDVFYTLNERVELIRETKPDLSISIHGNAMGITSDYSKSYGFLTFYSYNYVQDAAGIINSYVNETMGYANRTIRKANLSLTRLTACPAVLLETAFLTHPEDYEYLLNESNREKLSQAIAGAAKEYIESVAVYEQAKTHIIKRGDTLTSIAKKYGVTVNELAKANNITNVNVIRTGSVLTIPSK
ncbi:MAG: N-acetylmuramoyl-L-alanine amidase [Lachnospiraceae bacterium]|nr:N-acetylmuramoyl-L-alanine amidase [Lachnospiraceae bacterium]